MPHIEEIKLKLPTRSPSLCTCADTSEKGAKLGWPPPLQNPATTSDDYQIRVKSGGGCLRGGGILMRAGYQNVVVNVRLQHNT